MQRGKPRNRLLDYWVGTPLLNLLASVHRRRMPPRRIEHLGVMCAPALGDTLLFSGPLQDLRAALPESRITHVCMGQNLAAAEIIPGADRRLLIDLTRPNEAIRKLRAEQFDALIDFTVWQRLTAAITLLSGARYTVGFDTPGQHRARAYDRAVEHRRDLHELENHRALLAGSGLPMAVGAQHEPTIMISESAEMPFPEDGAVFAFHPWASGDLSSLREWPRERWVELAERLQAEVEGEPLFVVTGGPGDAERSEALVSEIQEAGLRSRAFVSPDGFRTLTALLRRCRVVVSVNTGVMHLAAVAGANTVGLNGPTAEARWGARGRCVENVQPADGSGGYLHLGFEFDGQPTDPMQKISVEQVEAACRRLMVECAAGMR